MNKTTRLEDIMIKHMPKFAQIECKRMVAEDEADHKPHSGDQRHARNRAAVLELVAAQPGITTAQAAELVDFSISALRLHLRDAVTEGQLRTVTVMRRMKYYPAVKTVNVNGDTK